jgi:hypothetical protein
MRIAAGLIALALAFSPPAAAAPKEAKRPVSALTAEAVNSAAFSPKAKSAGLSPVCSVGT